MNSIQLVGNITKDLELKKTPNDKSVTTFSIAVKRPHSDETDFFNITAWGNNAENCVKFLQKGSKVGIVGYIFNRSYTDRNGDKRLITEINATEIEFLSPKQVDKEQKEETVSVKRERPTLEQCDIDLPF